MSRRVITSQLQAAAASPIDTYFDKLVKYVPADIVGAWITATGMIAGAGQAVRADVILWICFVAGAALTPLWVLRQTRAPGLPPAYRQAAISTGAFAVWVFALGGPFAMLAFYHPLYGSLLLIFYTLVVALIDQ